ncbi:hypothetical protein H072_2282 [Dactylellina haptotyla CBS 200.50]|uniref:Topoisomerase 1-associated factor 1 n=1 Tax=Dactylellina haptotyla (strain CBS 200.50) TaxID=1284197 RepID=S8C7L5_DACHA|nr:hypothetical protein H072_2282 [Dactylellina haptotyla CBS 200.50]
MDNAEIYMQPAGFGAIDPSLRAHVYGLVTALGGPSPNDPERYTLGDDILGCLRDIKRWLKGYDEKLNRLDVARCLSEANLVVGDLLEILSHSLLRGDIASNQPNKVGLACVELLVPLTWPLDKTEMSMTINHHRHIPALRRSQVHYKQAILAHRSGSILKACCVNALPPMSLAAQERTARDESIIRLVLYFIRNILQIESVQEDSKDIKEAVSRSFVINSFGLQGVFSFLVSIISGIPELFEQQDVAVLEVLFQLLQGIEIQQLLTRVDKNSDRNDEMDANTLSRLLRNDHELKHTRKPQSRHNRFGTTVVFQKENGQKSVLSGNEALLSEENGLKQLDATKKWRKPQQVKKIQSRITGHHVYLDVLAQENLRRFLIHILKFGFNSLFQSVRKAVERDSERVIGSIHSTQLFYVGSIMMEIGQYLKKNGVGLTEGDLFEFCDLSSLLHAETFIVLFRHMREGLELKSRDDVQSGCLFFTQVLLMISEMMESGTPEEKSVAENILNRLFYEESLQDLMIAILRSGHKQSLRFLKIVTEMSHVYLRSLERYSRQNSSMVVKSKKNSTTQAIDPTESSGSDEELKTRTRTRAAEKQFDFLRCESKFLTQSSLETFLELLQHYKELDDLQLRRCINFLHRIFVKRGETVSLFRLKTILILQDIAYYTRDSKTHIEIIKFIQYFSKQLVRKLNENEPLFVELLFPKSTKTSYFLQHGKEREIQQKRPRLPPILEFNTQLDQDKQIAIAVSLVLQDDTCKGQLGWVESVLRRVLKERDDSQKALLSLDTSKEIPHATEKAPTIDQSEFAYLSENSTPVETLTENLATLLKYQHSPISELEDADGYVSVKKKRGANKGPEAEVDVDDRSEDAGYEFPDNPREVRRGRRGIPASGSPPEPKKKPDDEILRARREERRQRERERRMGIKSALYIASSDDDSDDERDREFLENERKQREAMGKATADALANEQAANELIGPRQKRITADYNGRRAKRARRGPLEYGSNSEERYLSNSSSSSSVGEKSE